LHSYTQGLYHFLELASEHEHAHLEGFRPNDAIGRVPELTRA
jgi:hypothetical protein